MIINGVVSAKNGSSQVQNLALAVLYVPYLLDSGGIITCEPGRACLPKNHCKVNRVRGRRRQRRLVRITILIGSTLGALSPRGGPIQDPVLTRLAAQNVPSIFVQAVR